MPEMATGQEAWSEKSAEAIVAGDGKGPNGRESEATVSLGRAKSQESRQLELPLEGWGNPLRHSGVNEAKSAVARPWGRKFLGYSFWVAPGKVVKRRVPPKALETMKQRVRGITTRSGGRSMRRVVTELRGYLLGWKEYFRLAETPGIFRDLDEWVRHRLRKVQLKQWKRGKTIYREMKRRGANNDAARRVAANSRRW